MSLPRATRKDTIDVRDYGYVADLIRVQYTSTSGSVLTGTTGKFSAAQVGMTALVEGGATAVTRTGNVIATNTANEQIVSSLSSALTQDYVGAVVSIPGAGVAGGVMVTQIGAIWPDGLTLMLKEAPPTTGGVTGATLTIQHYHRATITAVAVNGSTITLSSPPSATPPTMTSGGSTGPAVMIGTDNAAAITAATTALGTLAQASTSQYTAHGLSRWTPKPLVFPPGSALTSETNLFPQNNTSRISGLNISGSGVATTRLHYAPTAAGQYLMSDVDKWSRITIHGIEFTGISTLGIRPGFWNSQAAGAQQGHAFEQVEWSGTWKDIFYTHGTNTNDKWSWVHCRMTAKCIDNFFHIPAEGVTSADGNANQMHYEWTGGMFELWVGNKWNMGAAGNISDTGSFILAGYGTCYLLSGTTRLGARSIHSKNQKCEMRLPGCLFLDSTWTDGEILLDNPLLSEGGPGGTTNTDVIMRIDVGASPNGPLVMVRAGSWKGQVEVKYTATAGVLRQRKPILFEGAYFSDAALPENAFTFTKTDAGTNTGGIPIVRLRNCRSFPTSDAVSVVAWDVDLNWHAAKSAQVGAKVFRLANIRGKLPGSNGVLDFYLPMNALVRKVSVYVDAGLTANHTAGTSYKVQTTDSVPVVLATLTPTGNDPAQGWDVEAAARLRVTTTATQHLQVVASSGIPAELAGDLLVEYW